VQHLDGAGPAAVTLAGQIGIDPANGKPSARNVSVTAPQATPDAQGYAASSSAALGQVADAIVGMVGR